MSKGRELPQQFRVQQHVSVKMYKDVQLRLYVWRKSDLPLHIGQIHAFYFDKTPYTLSDNVNTKSVWLNN